ncbi:MAG: DUF3096 domain-containing protein [Chromatiaceae bacterium]
MNIELSNAVLAPALALLAGILILLAPRFLNYFVAVYLIVVGIVGLIPLLQRERVAAVNRSQALS